MYVHMVRIILTHVQLRTTITKICSSPQRRKRFRVGAEKAYKEKLAPSGKKLAMLMPIRDVRHRWNYTHAMVDRGHMLRKVNYIPFHLFISSS